MNKKLLIGLAASAAVIIAGACIWQGLQTKNKASDKAFQADSQNSRNPSGSGQKGRARGNFAIASGMVASVGDKSFTIKPENGGSAIVFYSDKTSIVKVVKFVAADLAVGQSVVVSGIKADDGTVTASTLMVRQPGETPSGIPQGGASNDSQNPGSVNPPVRNDGSDRGFVNGQIIAVDGSKITVKIPDGTEKTVILAEDAKITKSDAATINDLIEGVMVLVRGTNGSEGSIVAQMITIGGAQTFGAGVPVPEGNMMQGSQPAMDQQPGQAPAQLPQIQ